MTQTAQIATALADDDPTMHDELRLHGFDSAIKFMKQLVEILQAMPTITNTFEVTYTVDGDGVVRPCIRSISPNGSSKFLFKHDCEWVYHALTGHKPIFYLATQ